MSINWEMCGTVLIVHLGAAHSPADLAEAVVAAKAETAFRSGTFLLLDARQSKLNPTADEIRARCHSIAALRDLGLSRHCAVVLGSRPVQFGLARMAQAFLEVEGMDFGIFDDLDEALVWLSTIEP